MREERRDERPSWASMSPGERSFWLLRFVVSGGEREVRAALAAGACCDAMDSGRRTALMLAIRAKSAGCARALLEAGASVSVKGPEGKTALACAALSFPELIEELLDHGAEASEGGSRAFLEAASGTEPRALDILAQAGADPAAVNEKGEGALHLAALNAAFSSLGAPRSLAMAQAAWEAGAPLDEPDDQGWTPLHLATAFGNADLALWLLKMGADDARACGAQERMGMAFAGMAGLSAEGIALRAQAGSFAGDGVDGLARLLAARREAREIAQAAPAAPAAGRRAL